jgi:hypothetical protein
MPRTTVVSMECKVLPPRTTTMGQRNTVECTLFDPTSLKPIKTYRRSVVVGRHPYNGWERAMLSMAEQARKHYILLGGADSVW